MKRASLYILSVLLLCVCILSGCTKANTASLKNCYDLYVAMIEDYSTAQDKYVFDKTNNNKIDLYSTKAYSACVSSAISSDKKGFCLLAKDAQYDVVISNANSFYTNYQNYLNKDLIDYEGKTTQKAKTNLYKNIEAMKDACKEVVNTKEPMYDLCNATNAESEVMQQTLKRYLEVYQDFIGATIGVSVAFEQMFAEQIVSKVDAGIASGEGKRIVETAKLYVAQYIYLAYMTKDSQKILEDFSSKEVFQRLVTIYNSSNYNFSAEPTQEELELYEFISHKLEQFKNDMKNYEIAKSYYDSADKTSSYFDKNPYKVFVENFEQEVLDFENCIIQNMLS